jgi:replication factor C subunit 2/4
MPNTEAMDLSDPPSTSLDVDSDDDFLPSSASAKRELPWVEKYRPKSLTDVAHQTETVATLTNAVATGNLPHLLFYGPPGTGKTTMALALARTLWGQRIFKDRVLEMNASDERGISIVRNKVSGERSELV